MRRVDPGRIVLLLPNGPLRFPDPSRAPGDEPLALGGDLAVARLLLAYERGIFPWPVDGGLLTWWSPDPRALFRPETLRVSTSLARTLRRGRFALSWNRAFTEVIRECGRSRSDGTWITPAMRRAYEELHRRGHAHSLEVWDDAEALVGGVYGVQRGGLFAAESMFHRATDMSKVALVAAVRSLFRAGIEIFDAQLPTPHLARLGCEEWPRARYLERLAGACAKAVDLTALRPSVAP